MNYAFATPLTTLLALKALEALSAFLSGSHLNEMQFTTYHLEKGNRSYKLH